MRLTLVSAASPLRRVGKGAVTTLISPHDQSSAVPTRAASPAETFYAWARREDAPLPTLLTFKEAA
jgi:hypothetical protein